jgi:hypothetical protein
VDLTGVSPLVGLWRGTFIVAQTALKVALCKVDKYEKTCLDNQHAFLHFAFDTFIFLAPEIVSLLQRLQKVMNDNVENRFCYLKRDSGATCRFANHLYVIILYLLPKGNTHLKNIYKIFKKKNKK